MIKDFETYIAEGRMGRLIDAAKNNTERKEDVINSFYDLDEYMTSKYCTRNGVVYALRETPSKNITLPCSQNIRIVLYRAENEKIFSFSKIEIPGCIVPNEFFKKIPAENVNAIVDYMYSVIKIDKNIYSVGFNSLSGMTIRRHDEKSITPSEFITEVYDKLVDNCISDWFNIKRKLQ